MGSEDVSDEIKRAQNLLAQHHRNKARLANRCPDHPARTPEEGFIYCSACQVRNNRRRTAPRTTERTKSDLSPDYIAKTIRINLERILNGETEGVKAKGFGRLEMLADRLEGGEPNYDGAVEDEK